MSRPKASPRTIVPALAALLLGGGVAAAGTPAPTPSAPRPTTAAPPAPVAIENFGEVEAGLYRGAKLGEPEIAELRRLGVRTVLKLNERELAEETRLAAAAGIRVVAVPLDTFDVGEGEEGRAALCRALGVMRDPALRPLYVHCTHGVDRTGAVVGIYRRLVSGWDLERVRAEMERYGSGALRRLFTPAVYRAVEGFDAAACRPAAR